MKKQYHIYKIVNNVNDKVYIGQTGNPKGRFYACHYHGKMKKAIEDIGWENFTPVLIETTDSKDNADRLEAYYIGKYDSVNNGYNSSFRFSAPPQSRSKKSNIKRSKTMSKKLWFHNPKTGETLRLFVQDEVPAGFISGRGTLQRYAGHDF